MPSAAPIRLAIVEDLDEERERLASLLAARPEFKCVAACATAEEALKTIPPLAPHIILMDIQLPGISGIDCVRRIKKVLPSTEVMMLTVFEDHERIFESLAAGATGYLLKKASPEDLCAAIKELHAGGAPMSGQIARLVVSAFRRPAAAEAELSKLSPGEQSVLQRLARGLLYKEIAAELGISISTVRTHIYHIYEKLRVHNRTEAINKVLKKPAAP